MRTTVRILAILSTIACLSGLHAVPAYAATQEETRDHTIRETTRFSAVGCREPAEHIVVLPRRSQSITPVGPLAGTELYGSDPRAPVAVVAQVSYAPGIVTWRVTGTGASCTPGTLWETGVVDLKVQVTTVRRVLTRATVIRRADAICRRTVRGVSPLLDSAASPSTPRSSAVAKISAAARIVRSANRKLGALAVPQTRKIHFNRLRRELDALQLAGERAADALRDKDRPAAYAAFVAADRARAQAASAARRYGIRGCD